ncbi:MAG TPA: AMP nucleosidase [Waddliaceae bacterium]
MRDIGKQEFNPLEAQIAVDTLERYSGSDAKDFQPYLLLTNFPKYVEYFANSRNITISQGSAFSVAHSTKEHVSILDFKIGSPAAALAIDLCANLPIKAALLLGMCGGLRREYHIGDYFVPVGAIRGEGTSDFYFPSEVPAMANFLMQKYVTNVLTEQNARYHIGITHTTNKRFWEFNSLFRERLVLTRPQAIEMECATLFMASYYNKLPLGAFLLISDLPLNPEGIKTKKISETVYIKHTLDHVEKGAKILLEFDKGLKKQPKGVFRGIRRRFEALQGT